MKSFLEHWINEQTDKLLEAGGKAAGKLELLNTNLLKSNYC